MPDDLAAFTGTIGYFKTIPSRGVCSVSIEVDISQMELVARVASHGSWVAVARIQPPAEQNGKERRRWNELSPAAQAGILCTAAEFIEYIGAKDSEEAIYSVRERCHVASRSELSTNSRAAREWQRIESGFRSWQQARNQDT